MSAADPRSVTEVDEHIGQRIRARRNELKLPLRHVASVVGVTYQQLQKYESGDTRVSATMLTKIAEALGGEVSDFLPGGGVRRRKASAASEDGLALQLQAAFAQIVSSRERRLLLDLTRRLAAAAKDKKPPRAKRRR